MSSFALTSCLAAVLLGGCMRIYSDPELPDVEVEWTEYDCVEEDRGVSVVLVRIADESRTEMTVACSDLGVTFTDVLRERYHVEAAFVGPDGEPLTVPSTTEVDLRPGLNKRVYVYLARFPNFRVAWTFEAGATCDSLGADSMALVFSSSSGPLGYGSNCDSMLFLSDLPIGSYTLALRALANATPVAVSGELAVEIRPLGGILDLGVVTLVPCTGTCP